MRGDRYLQGKAMGPLSEIWVSAVHKHALENGYTVVREIGGHGVGLEFHEDPWVSYTSEENSGVIMEPGMMFTIEPMVNMGSDEVSGQMSRMTGQCAQRTVLPSAPWEVTVLVTEDRLRGDLLVKGS